MPRTALHYRLSAARVRQEVILNSQLIIIINYEAKNLNHRSLLIRPYELLRQQERHKVREGHRRSQHYVDSEGARFPGQDTGEDIHPQRQGAEDSGTAQPRYALGVRAGGDTAEEVRGQECRRGGADEGGRRERCHLLVESPHTEREGRTEILPGEQEVERLT